MEFLNKLFGAWQRGGRRNPRRQALALLCALSLAGSAAADFPDRPLRLVVTTQAGGNNDAVARIVAPRLSESLGQPVVVENRPGASGMIGARQVAASPPDGYTLLIGTTSLAMLPATFNAPAVDARKDFLAVGNMVEVPVVLVAGKAFKPATLQETIAAAKAAPGRVTMAITVPSFIFYSERMSLEAGMSLTRVSYKGTPDAMNDVIGGRVDLMLDTVGLQLPHIRAGNTRPLAVFTEKRHPLLPEVPTMDEAGFKGFADNPFVGVFAPARTPAAVVERLNAELQKALRNDEVRGKLEGMGFLVTPVSSGFFARRVHADIDRYEEIARKANLPKD